MNYSFTPQSHSVVQCVCHSVPYGPPGPPQSHSQVCIMRRWAKCLAQQQYGLRQGFEPALVAKGTPIPHTTELYIFLIIPYSQKNVKFIILVPT